MFGRNASPPGAKRLSPQASLQSRQLLTTRSSALHTECWDSVNDGGISSSGGRLPCKGGRRKAKRSYSKATLRSLKSMCSLAIKGEVSARGCSGSSCALRRQNLPYCLPLRSSTRTTARSSSTANLGSPTSHVTTSTPLIRGHLRFLGDRCHSAPHQCCRFVVVTR